MAILLALPVLSLAVIMQSAILSQILLLQGTADLVLVVVVSWIMQARVKAAWQWAVIGGLMVGFVSQLPFWLPVGAYLAITAMGTAFKRRVWQVPLLALLATTLLGTLLFHALTFVVLRLQGTPLALGEAFNQITLPSTLLNLLLALPVQAVTAEISRWVYPVEEDE